MTLPSWHIHISEREPDGSWEDCTWDSGLEWYRLCYDKRVPATHAEAQLLRHASGEPDTGGSNIGDLKRGIKIRYGKATPAPLGTFNSLWAALLPGYAAVVQGSMGAFGPDHRLSRYDRNFDGGHAVMVMRLDGTDRVWWCDPEGPKTGYEGEWVTKMELTRFVTAFGGQHIVSKILAEPIEATPPPVTGDDMPALTSYTPGDIATVKATANIRNAPKITKDSKLRVVGATGETWEIVGMVKGDVDPDTKSDLWYIRWNAGRWEYTAKGNVTKTVDPSVLASAEKVQLTAEISAASTALAAANAKITKARTALS